jgi:PBSX family phage portal protein
VNILADITTKNSGNKVSVRVIKADSSIRPKEASTQINDPQLSDTSSNEYIDPPYDPELLLKLPEQNNILQALLDAYMTNITGFGYSFKYTIDMESQEIEESMKEQAKKEWVMLSLLYDNCSYDKTFTQITKSMIRDRENIGWGTIEVIPRGDGKPGGFEWVPAHTIRLTKVHPDIQTIPIVVVGIDGKQLKVSYAKRFRRFVQIRDNERVWFKEFGDPRRMSARTGKFEVELDDNGNEVRTEIPPEEEATSLIYFPIEVSYTPYGVPRWLGNILSVTGSRKSEELNFAYFSKGKHIPMAILVKNGSLTQSSIDELQSYANKLDGVENAHGYLILEAEGFDAGEGFDENSSPVDIKLQPLTQVIQHDALFQEYDNNNRDKIRASFRLPPIYTGESKDYTRATADTARAIAEEQVFNPEREAIAHKFNRLINAAYGIKYCQMYFKSPNLSNKIELAQAVQVYAKAGALTPNMLIGAVSELLGEEFEYIQEEWGNIPLQLSIEMLRANTLKVEPKGSKNQKPSFTDDSSEGGSEDDDTTSTD